MEKQPKLFKSIIACVSAATLLFTLNVNAEQSKSQVETVGNLLLNSSAARKVARSEDKQVKRIYQQAKDYYLQAQDSTDPVETKRLLGLVVQNMVKVGKLADQGAALGNKKKSDFDNRLGSINALLVAQQNIAEEKESDKATASQVRENVNDLVLQAKALSDNHDYVQGRETLDVAYTLLKTSIEQMRGGDTLVNSLNFETPADEYEYYQTKTSSQLSALNMIKSKTNNANKLRMIGGITKSATKLIDDSKILADEGDHSAAIKLIEKALTRLQSGLMMALN